MAARTRILLTGATGHVGSWVHRLLVEAGCDVTACARKERMLPEAMAAHTTWRLVDITDIDSVKAAFSSAAHDHFIHLASEKTIPAGERDPSTTVLVNVCGTAHVLAAAAAHGVRSGSFASSWAVYPPQSVGRSYTEDTPLQPFSVYGETKQMGERLFGMYAAAQKIPNMTLLRLFNVAGSISYPGAAAQTGFFEYVAKALREGGAVTIAGNDFPTPDGTCARDFVDVRDVARAFVESLSFEGVGVFNIGSGEAHSLEEVVAAFEKKSGTSVERVIAPRRPNDPAYACADIGAARSAFGYEPHYGLADMVKETISL